MEIRDTVREEIILAINLYFLWVEWESWGKEFAPIMADQILAIKELAVVDRDAELPDNVCESDDGEDFTIGYELAQQDMLKANYVKEVK